MVGHGASKDSMLEEMTAINSSKHSFRYALHVIWHQVLLAINAPSEFYYVAPKTLEMAEGHQSRGQSEKLALPPRNLVDSLVGPIV